MKRIKLSPTRPLGASIHTPLLSIVDIKPWQAIWVFAGLWWMAGRR